MEVDEIKKVRADKLEKLVSNGIVPYGSKFVISDTIANTLDHFTEEKEIDRAKNEFVALASHQLRTPLSIINWYADGLLSGTVGGTPEGRKKYLDGIYQANRRMIELVDALLNVSRIDLGTIAIKPEPIQLKSMAMNILGEFEPQVKSKRLIVSVDYDESLPVVNADHKFMRVIIENLVSNAVKYTPSDGKITVRFKKQDPNILISVEDTGFGIPSSQKEKVFTKLFRADNVRAKDTDGTGLGLYIVKSVVEQTGGKVWFESTENKGTTFYVTLPLKGMRARDGIKELS